MGRMDMNFPGLLLDINGMMGRVEKRLNECSGMG